MLFVLTALFFFTFYYRKCHIVILSAVVRAAVSARAVPCRPLHICSYTVHFYTVTLNEIKEMEITISL